MSGGLVVGIIGGGVMGESIARALLHCNAPQATLRVVEVSSTRRAQLSTVFPSPTTQLMDSASSASFLNGLHVLVVAVKPQYARVALKGVVVDKECVVISIMAGVTLQTLAELLGSNGNTTIVRAMPNTAASIGKSATVWVSSTPLNVQQKQRVEYVLGSMGLAVEAPAEHFIDFATGLVGSGPAFVFLVVEAFIDAGVHLGFTRASATELVIQLFEGCVALLRARPDTSIAQQRWNVTSPGKASCSCRAHSS